MAAGYPSGKSMRLPAGRLSMFVPGSGEVADSYDGVERKENSAFHCGEKISMVAGKASTVRVSYKRF